MTRDAQRAATRERLLDSARRMFARHGFGGTSIDLVAADAGYTKGAVYSNFASKEDLFLELLGRHMADEAAQLEALLAAPTSLAGVTAALDRWFEQMTVDADWPLLSMELQLHAKRSAPFAERYAELHDAHRARLGVLVERLFRLAGKALPARRNEIAGLLMALAHGLAIQTTGARTRPGRSIRLVLHALLDAADAAAE